MTTTTTGQPVPYSHEPFPGTHWHGSGHLNRSCYLPSAPLAGPAMRLTIEQHADRYVLQVDYANLPAGIEPWEEELLDAQDWTRGPALGLDDALAFTQILADKVDRLVRLRVAQIDPVPACAPDGMCHDAEHCDRDPRKVHIGH